MLACNGEIGLNHAPDLLRIFEKLAGQLHGGRHIRCPEDTEITNLHLTILSLLGVRMDNLGNSTGKLELLSV